MKNMTPKKFIYPGHNACAGCGQLSAVQAVMRALDENTIIANATGCLEVTTTAYPNSAWGLPWVHSLFENAAAVASGIRAGLDYQARKHKGAKAETYKNTKILVQGGDGGTFDIGFGLVSGLWERGDQALYVCYDTEAYSNTGIQASSSTPYGANTTTSPAGHCEEKNICQNANLIGSRQAKKDMIAIALAHGLKYVAQSTAGFPDDITRKVRKALATPGPSYIQILAPCIPGWKIGSHQAAALGKLAAQTGLYPLLEYTDGQLTSTFKIPDPAPKVEEYLKHQGRFKHLFKDGSGLAAIAHIQALADKNIEKYNLK
jgi:pyruvate ferredoxin oxidoreductase beta subunit